MMGQELAEKSLEVQELQCHREMVKIEVNEASLLACLQQYFPEQGSLMIWAIQTVTAGIWDGKDLTLADDDVKAADILELRLFSPDSELHLKRADDTFVGRYVRDSQGAGTEVVDSFSRLWGEQQPQMSPDGLLRLLDAPRKLTLTVPCAGSIGVTRYLGLTTRNYIGYEKETGLAGYVDMRFVSIDPVKGK